MLDWSYNYQANNMYQQVPPTEIDVKTNCSQQQQQQQQKIIYNCVCIHTNN